MCRSQLCWRGQCVSNTDVQWVVLIFGHLSFPNTSMVPSFIVVFFQYCGSNIHQKALLVIFNILISNSNELINCIGIWEGVEQLLKSGSSMTTAILKKPRVSCSFYRNLKMTNKYIYKLFRMIYYHTSNLLFRSLTFSH